MTQKVIGILGGMGPAATLELFTRIIDNTAAEADQEHVNMIIINDPQIPDRSKYILEDGASPIPKLIENLNKLFYAGADVAVIPCMTAHSFINELNKTSPIPIINAISLVEEHIQTEYPSFNKVGLLATNGSVHSGVYQRYISKEIVVPEKAGQMEVMDIIYGNEGIKSGNTSSEVTDRIRDVTDKLKKEDIEAVIAGCTELSLVMDEKSIDIPVIDPITLLAKKVVMLGNNYATKLNNR
ncbi:cysteate racemase [Oceanobacillus profundus]|uniref:Amino acid racemase n=1 Tax=Oceanobacillus profundus TaxID=372463 RepID=A0A417YPJ2_9BACI|nr:amino acid racemase [Oceanobacillus profundus]RHW35508.1 amino acid racemase [Oceanobacillus profundus]